MERIVIEVEEAVAKKWRYASRMVKNNVAQRVSAELEKEFSDTKKEFVQFLDETGATMQDRGLTEDILDKLLKEDA